MAPTGTASQFDQAALDRRVALQGKAGPGALLQNAKVFGYERSCREAATKHVDPS